MLLWEQQRTKYFVLELKPKPTKKPSAGLRNTFTPLLAIT